MVPGAKASVALACTHVRSILAWAWWIGPAHVTVVTVSFVPVVRAHCLCAQGGSLCAMRLAPLPGKPWCMACPAKATAFVSGSPAAAPGDLSPSAGKAWAGHIILVLPDTFKRSGLWTFERSGLWYDHGNVT